MTNDQELDTALKRVRAASAKMKKAEKKRRDVLVSSVFDAYRAVLGDCFTPQGVIDAATDGVQIKNWDSLDDRTKILLVELGAKYPVSTNREAVANLLSELLVGSLREKGATISEDQGAGLTAIVSNVIAELAEAGVAFDNGVRQAYLPGLAQLAAREQWLTTDASSWMDLDRYSHELDRTSVSIAAAQNALAAALVAAGTVVASSRSERKEIIRIASVEPKRNLLEFESNPYQTFEFSTHSGRRGTLDVAARRVEVPWEEDVAERYGALLSGKHKDRYNSQPALEPGIDVRALVAGRDGGDVILELRTAPLRKALMGKGIDFTTDPITILVNSTQRETITFFYKVESDAGLVVGLSFDERYNGSSAFVGTEKWMDEEIQRANGVKKELDGKYTPLLEPVTVHTYVTRKKRLTQQRP